MFINDPGNKDIEPVLVIFRQFDAVALSVVHLVLAIGVTAHVLLHKRDIGASIGWIGLAWLSPILGSILYWCSASIG